MMAIPGTDLLEVPTISYVRCKGVEIDPQNMALDGTVPPF